jgi:hypothetical protein
LVEWISLERCIKCHSLIKELFEANKMLKTVSSVANALGALNYKGTWNASTNTPTLASGVGTQGDYYVVSVAGATDLDGITNWGVGDWAAFNGSVWQRVEGGADGNFVNLDVTGTSNLASLNVTPGISSLSVVDAANSAVSYPVKVSHLPSGTTGNGLGVGIDFYLKNSTYSMEAQVATIEAVGINEIDIAHDLVFKTKWQNSLAERARLQGRANTAGVVDFKLSNGNVIMGTSGSGIDFSATAGTGTSELLDDYEEGVWTPTLVRPSAGGFTYTPAVGDAGYYTKVGNICYVSATLGGTFSGGSGYYQINGLPFNNAGNGTALSVGNLANLSAGAAIGITVANVNVASTIINGTPVSGNVHSFSAVYAV